MFRLAALIGAMTAVAVCAATAGAKVYESSATQTVVDANAGASTMSAP